MITQAPPKNYPVTELMADQAIITEPWNYWTQNIARGLGVLQAASAVGYSGTVPLAKITGGGTNGSLTVVNGLITAVTVPT